MTDVVMPEMSGLDLAGRLTGSLPGLRVIVMSGHSDEIVTAFGTGNTPYPLLRKPFRLPELANAIANELTREGSAHTANQL